MKLEVYAGKVETSVDIELRGSSKKITENFGRHGKNAQQIEHIILTRAYIDHSGSAAELNAYSGEIGHLSAAK
jgi:glyoxylase-like metal-dependent hydrolase (beta-lactamase superfamily II)